MPMDPLTPQVTDSLQLLWLTSKTEIQMYRPTDHPKGLVLNPIYSSCYNTDRMQYFFVEQKEDLISLR